MSVHTPWKMPEKDYWSYADPTVFHVPVRDANDELVSAAQGSTLKEAQNIARLIAAAPDMLAALEHVTACLYASDAGDARLDDAFEFELVMEAIAKAKGEQQ